MKLRLFSFFSSLISSFLALIGFAGCDSEGNEPAVMYGTPHGDFRFNGLVNDEGGAPIKDARVIVRPHSDKNGNFFLWDADTVYTDITGKYNGEMPSFTNKVMIVCEDPQKQFMPDSTVVSLNYVKPDKNDPWHIGTATTTVDFTLKKASEKEKE